MFDNGSLLRRRKRFKTTAQLLKQKQQQALNQTGVQTQASEQCDPDDFEYEDDDYEGDYDNETNLDEETEDNKSMNSFLPAADNKLITNQFDAFVKKQAEHQYLQYFQNSNQTYPMIAQQQLSNDISTSSMSSTSSLAVSVISNKTVNISPMSSASSSSFVSTPDSSKSRHLSSSPHDNDDIEYQQESKAKKQKVSSSFSIDSLIGNNTATKEKSTLNKLNSQSIAIKHRPIKTPKSKTVIHSDMFKPDINENIKQNKKFIYQQYEQQQLFNDQINQTTKQKPTSHNSLINSRGTSISSNNSRIESRSSNSSGSRCVSPSNNLSVEVENNSDAIAMQKNYINQAMINSIMNSNYKRNGSAQSDVANRVRNTLTYFNNPNMFLHQQQQSECSVSPSFTSSVTDVSQQQKTMNQSQHLYKLLNETMLMRAAAVAAAQSAQINYMLYNQSGPLNSQSQLQGHQTLTATSSASSTSSNSNQTNVNI